MVEWTGICKQALKGFEAKLSQAELTVKFVNVWKR